MVLIAIVIIVVVEHVTNGTIKITIAIIVVVENVNGTNSYSNNNST